MSQSSIAAIKRHRTAQLAKLATRAYRLHRKGQDREMNNMICEEFVALGGVYIKFLQGVMLQSSLMRDWRNPDRMKIFENLDSEPLDVVAILRRELSPEKLKEISLIQPQPFAAGSFGQVYYGQHVSGKPIVIKVLRPMIHELLKYDLKLIGHFYKQAARFNKNMAINIDAAMKEFTDATLKETDYPAEAQFARELYETYKEHPTFIIPETFVNLCTKNIIVQEYIGGISAAQLIKLQEQGVEVKQYVKDTIGSDLDEQLFTLGFESLNGVFTLPRIQGDPHPGNVRLLDGNKVGLIDFGIAAHTPTNKAAFFGIIEEWNKLYTGGQSIGNLFEQFIRFFVSDLYKSLKRLSTFNKTPEQSKENFTKEVGKVAQETFNDVTGSDDITSLLENGKIMQIINRVVNKENRFGLIVKLEASEILRAAQTYMTLVETLGRRNVVMPRVFAAVVEEVRTNNAEVLHQGEDTTNISDALETVSGWLERVAERDPTLFRELTKRIKLGEGKRRKPSPTQTKPVEAEKEPTNA